MSDRAFNASIYECNLNTSFPIEDELLEKRSIDFFGLTDNNDITKFDRQVDVIDRPIFGHAKRVPHLNLNGDGELQKNSNIFTFIKKD